MLIKKEVGLMIGVMFGINWFFSALIAIKGGGLENNIPSTLVLMFSPALLSILFQYAYNKNFKDCWLKFRLSKNMFMAYIIPILYVFAMAAIALILGITNLNSVEILKLSFVNVPQIFLVNILIGMIIVLGEEVCWRGYLLPKVSMIYGRKKAVILVGVLWIFAHYPILFFSNYNASGVPIWFSAINFTIVAMAANIVISALSSRDLSMWPAVIFHAVHNSMLQDINPLLEKSKTSGYFLSEFGILLPILVSILALYYWKEIKLNESDARSSSTLGKVFEKQ